MVIFPLAPDQTIAQMWSNGARGSRSSKVIELSVNGMPICDFLLVINCNFSRGVFEIFRLKDKKLLILPTPSLFDAPLGGTP